MQDEPSANSKLGRRGWLTPFLMFLWHSGRSSGERGKQRLMEGCTWELADPLLSGLALKREAEWQPGVIFQTQGYPTLHSLGFMGEKLLEEEHCSRMLLSPGVSQKDLSVKVHSVSNTHLERCFGKERGHQRNPVTRRGERSSQTL